MASALITGSGENCPAVAECSSSCCFRVPGEIRYGVGKVALVVPGETVEYGVIGGRANRDPLGRMVAGCTGE